MNYRRMDLWVVTIIIFISSITIFGVQTKTQLPTKEDIVDNSVAEYETNLTPVDFAEAENLQELTTDEFKSIGINIKSDPTMGSKSEGDIAIDNIQQFVNDSNRLQRNAIRSRWRRWPNALIPYTISSRYGSYSKKVISKAMDEYHKRTCIKFVERDSSKHRDYIYIHPDDGCYSLVGRTGGRQPLSLDAGCITHGVIVHELMHTVGFFHEHSRADREDAIQIVWKNVIYEAQDQFEKYSLRTISHLETEYDYNSIMHYGPYAFSRNGRKTILPKKSGYSRMGQRSGFSATDIKKINSLYHCPDEEEDKDKTKTVKVTVRPPIAPKPKPKPKPNKPAPKPTECKDYNWRCMFWAMGVFDYCSKYKEVREEICPKACGACSSNRETSGEITTKRPTTLRPPMITESPTSKPSDKISKKKCRDKNPSCPRWASKGHCNWPGYTNFMKDTCPLSCKKCKDMVKAQTEPSPSTRCKDNPGYKTYCAIANSIFNCGMDNEKKQMLLRKNCAKTCGFCDDLNA